MGKYLEELKSIFDVANLVDTDATCCDEWLNYMEKRNEPVLISEIVDCVPGVDSSQLASAYARRLSELGILNIIDERGRRYYSLPEKFGNEYLHKIKIKYEAKQLTLSMLDELYKAESSEDLINRIRNEESVDDLIGKAQQIKDDKDQLEKYLCLIARLESNIISFKKRHEQLLEDRRKIVRNTDYAVNCLIAEEEIGKRFDECNDDIRELKKLIKGKPKLSDQERIPRPIKPEAPRWDRQKPEEPTYAKPGLFNKKRVEQSNATLKANYEKELCKYNEEYERFLCAKEKYSQDLLKYNSDISAYEIENAAINQKEYEAALVAHKANTENWKSEIAQKESEIAKLAEEKETMLLKTELYANRKRIEYELQYLEQEIRKNIKAENALYQLGVVYAKYRNYVAISTFVDYLKSGRCVSLDGPNGAYNIYEQESRADIIINKLDTIILSLETIKENQFYIYNELQNINASLDLINGQLLINNILQAVQVLQLDEIACNTKVSAFYAKKNAALTDALGYMVALG